MSQQPRGLVSPPAATVGAALAAASGCGRVSTAVAHALGSGTRSSAHAGTDRRAAVMCATVCRAPSPNTRVPLATVAAVACGLPPVFDRPRLPLLFVVLLLVCLVCRLVIGTRRRIAAKDVQDRGEEDNDDDLQLPARVLDAEEERARETTAQEEHAHGGKERGGDRGQGVATTQSLRHGHSPVCDSQGELCGKGQHAHGHGKDEDEARHEGGAPLRAGEGGDPVEGAPAPREAEHDEMLERERATWPE
mmetsp:Transcript_4951/g.13628  ORF Transcript_4951/g.13628 Transcript_4951/m.13628 type:complete len:249 (-) Transcript_4951:222-968(-)